jgi:hypothetical protein
MPGKSEMFPRLAGIPAADQWINPVCIKPRIPRLHGKVERSHGNDERELYQRLSCKDEVELNRKSTQREDFYKLHRPHGSMKGRTPYEILQSHLEK